MAKIMLICGKICAGKSTYAKKLMVEQKAVRLNADELMKVYCGEFAGDRHEEFLQLTLHFLYQKAIEIHATGINVILDCGFWQRHYREEANQYFREHQIKPEWHYVDIDEVRWKQNIEKRNRECQSGLTQDYFVSEDILKKFRNSEDKPKPEDIDVWWRNE